MLRWLLLQLLRRLLVLLLLLALVRLQVDEGRDAGGWPPTSGEVDLRVSELMIFLQAVCRSSPESSSGSSIGGPGGCGEVMVGQAEFRSSSDR